MTDFATIAETYLRAWNETDATRRQALIEETWTADALYADPMAGAEGHTAIAQLIGAVHAQFPGLVFTISREADGHGRQLRFGWGLGEPGGTPVAYGFDVVVLDEDDRITEVRGFLDEVPAAA